MPHFHGGNQKSVPKMMRPFYTLLLAGTGLLMSAPAKAQMIKDPTNWTYELKKKSATEYDLVFHVRIADGWHIWSLTPGGDGFQVVPSFRVDRNPAVTVKGKPAEKGTPVTVTMDGIEGKVTYLSGAIDYTQTITVTGNTIVTGVHEYQVCNDQMCLPPKEKKFSFTIQ
jgi:thiol:disulfide interchange protein DsbD